MLVRLAVAFPAVVGLGGSNVEPRDELPGADLGLLRPAPVSHSAERTRTQAETKEILLTALGFQRFLISWPSGSRTG